MSVFTRDSVYVSADKRTRLAYDLGTGFLSIYVEGVQALKMDANTPSGGFAVLSTAQLTLAEVDVLDGVAPGTVLASKAFVADANKRVSGIGAVALDGITVNSLLGMLTIGTVVTAAGADASANVGRTTGLSINLLNSGATVTGFRAIDARITDNGTAANGVAVQGLLTKASGVSTGEGWTGNFILTMTGGKYEDVFGVSSDVVIGASASVGSASSPAVNNLVAGRFSSYVDTSATLSSVTIDAPVLGILNGGANNRAKADAVFMAMIDGGGAGTVTAESAFAVRDYGDAGAGDEFDYGLNLYFDSAPFANTFAVADIKLSGAAEIYSGVAVTRAAARAAAGDSAPVGSIFVANSAVATTKPNLYVKTANGAADTDWERIVTQASD
jgi:hypothetical protein